MWDSDKSSNLCKVWEEALLPFGKTPSHLQFPVPHQCRAYLPKAADSRMTFLRLRYGIYFSFACSFLAVFWGSILMLLGEKLIDLDSYSFSVLSCLHFFFFCSFTRVIGFIRASEGNWVLREKKEYAWKALPGRKWQYVATAADSSVLSVESLSLDVFIDTQPTWEHMLSVGSIRIGGLAFVCISSAPLLVTVKACWKNE